MRKAVYPGTFDPFSNGHYDIIKRASKLYDKLYILVSNNIAKKTIFSVEERVEMIKQCVDSFKNVIVEAYDGLVVNYCKENQIQVILRGLRNYQDFESEGSLFHFNHNIDPEIETLFLLPDSKNEFISSSSIKELVHFDCDISNYVPKEIQKKIIEKLKKNTQK